MDGGSVENAEAVFDLATPTIRLQYTQKPRESGASLFAASNGSGVRSAAGSRKIGTVVQGL